jgi:recombination protein RecA
VKNKVAPPFREAMFVLIHGQGLLREAELLEIGSKTGIVNKSGAWYTYGTEKIGQGLEAAIEFLKTNPKIAQKIENEIRKNIVQE